MPYNEHTKTTTMSNQKWIKAVLIGSAMLATSSPAAASESSGLRGSNSDSRKLWWHYGKEPEPVATVDPTLAPTLAPTLEPTFFEPEPVPPGWTGDAHTANVEINEKSVTTSSKSSKEAPSDADFRFVNVGEGASLEFFNSKGGGKGGGGESGNLRDDAPSEEAPKIMSKSAKTPAAVEIEKIDPTWNGDGHPPEPEPILTPKPTDSPTKWNGDGHPPEPEPIITPEPTKNPSKSPTNKPSRSPTNKPSNNPTRKPSNSPTRKPTKSPVVPPVEPVPPTPAYGNPKPTNTPTKAPKVDPVPPTPSYGSKPTDEPTDKPTESPIIAPVPPTPPGYGTTSKPTDSPTKAPTEPEPEPFKPNLPGMNFKRTSFTECDEIRGGNPPVCLDVCTEITSIWDGETLIDEFSKTEEKKCPEWKEFVKEQEAIGN